MEELTTGAWAAYGAPLPRQLSRTEVCQAFGKTHPLRNRTQPLALSEILRRGDHRHHHGLPVRRGTDLLEQHAVRLGRQLLPVAAQLRVVGEEVISANLVTREGLRRRDVALRRQAAGQESETEHDRGAGGSHSRDCRRNGDSAAVRE